MTRRQKARHFLNWRERIHGIPWQRARGANTAVNGQPHGGGITAIKDGTGPVDAYLRYNTRMGVYL